MSRGSVSTAGLVKHSYCVKRKRIRCWIGEAFLSILLLTGGECLVWAIRLLCVLSAFWSGEQFHRVRPLKVTLLGKHVHSAELLGKFLCICVCEVTSLLFFLERCQIVFISAIFFSSLLDYSILVTFLLFLSCAGTVQIFCLPTTLVQCQKRIASLHILTNSDL